MVDIMCIFRIHCSWQCLLSLFILSCTVNRIHTYRVSFLSAVCGVHHAFPKPLDLFHLCCADGGYLERYGSQGSCKARFDLHTSIVMPFPDTVDRTCNALRMRATYECRCASVRLDGRLGPQWVAARLNAVIAKNGIERMVA